jgi:tRNA (guanine-N7-)-methyltransferase
LSTSSAGPLPEPRSDRRGGPVFYGRRHGKKLRQRGQDLMRDLLPRLAVPGGRGGDPLDPFSLFDPPVREVWLEVGFGGGEHLAAQAEANPAVGIIGGEVFVNGIASLLNHVDRRGLGNVRIFPDDIRHLLPRLPEACLGRVFVLFPDPWPKKRHAERRFVIKGNLDVLARLMRDGAELRVASDDPTYQAWALEQLEAHPLFVSGRAPEERAVRPADWQQTRYEAKAIREGRPPIYLSYLRRPR